MRKGAVVRKANAASCGLGDEHGNRGSVKRYRFA